MDMVTPLEPFKCQDLGSGLQQRLIKQAIRAVVNAREEQIKERIRAAGFTPSKRFVKEHLTLLTFSDRPHYKELYYNYTQADERFICSWDDTPDFKIDGQLFTVTLGKI